MKKLIILPLISFTILMSSCNKEIPSPVTFAFDSWSTLRMVANEGLEHLKEVYHPIANTFVIQDLNNPIEVEAKTRQLYIEGVGKFSLRVIGENHDVDKDGKKIPLTFELTSVIKAVPYSLSSIKSNCWLDSELRNFLNHTFNEWVPKDLKDNLVPALKTTRIGGGDDNFKTSQESFFPLTPMEYYLTDKGISEDDQHYAFYEKHKDDVSGEGTTESPTRNIWNKDSNSYWLRAPLENTTINSYIVRDHDEKKTIYSILYIEDVCQTLSVAPCFCI